jgi:hypothetical protein
MPGWYPIVHDPTRGLAPGSLVAWLYADAGGGSDTGAALARSDYVLCPHLPMPAGAMPACARMSGAVVGGRWHMLWSWGRGRPIGFRGWLWTTPVGAAQVSSRLRGGGYMSWHVVDQQTGRAT